MALSDVLGPIRRRWYILLVGLFLAGAMGWATASVAPSQYTARGLVILLPSAVTTGPRGNPLLNLGGLELPARILIAYYASEPAQSDLKKSAPKADAVVTMEESTRGPIIAVDVKDTTPDGAMRVLQEVTDSIPENLARIQSEVGTAKRAAVGSMPLVVDREPQRDISGVVRLVVASVVAMLALTFFVVFSLDGIALRRARLDHEGNIEGEGEGNADAIDIKHGAIRTGRVANEGLEPIETSEEGAPIVAEQEDSPATDEASAYPEDSLAKQPVNGNSKPAEGHTDAKTPPSQPKDSPAEDDAGTDPSTLAPDEARSSRASA